MLFDTHQYRLAGNIVAYQLAEMKKHGKLLTRMAEMVTEGLQAITEADMTAFGQLLHESWQMKRQLSKHVSTPAIDSIYEAGMKAGAVGGKLLGAGGGGFIIFFAEPRQQEAIKQSLSELTYVPFQFEQEGTKVIYRD